MAYFTPYIDATGFHMPAYADILAYLTDQYRAIFGADIYLGNDSQDYQWISVLASLAYDNYLLAQQSYFNRGSATATQNGLDGVVAINGIRRKPATFSKAQVVLDGDSGALVYNGIISEGAYHWALPSLVQVGQTDAQGNPVLVEATCLTAGLVLAPIGTLTHIVTPALGWQSVTNPEPAIPGHGIEKDSELRARQAYSVSQPSQSILDGLRGSLADLEGVRRSVVYENDTNEIDSKGLPPHSVTVVVEGGDDAQIAKVIYTHKTPGCYSHGDVVQSVLDRHGQANLIRFYRPDYVSIKVAVTVRALTGYTTETTERIRGNILEYLDGLKIGDLLTLSALWGVSLAAMPDIKSPTFSITSVLAAKEPGTLAAADVVLNFQEASLGDATLITITTL
jgi:uncharacterized phage protein gp47/JayE